jgi:hypothetical protein
MAPFAPTLNDLNSVIAILAAFRLPNELALSILDCARYWTEYKVEYTDPIILVDEHWSLDYSAAYPYLHVPVYHGQHEPLKIREIAFTIVSHDQGWTSEQTIGSYETSSWFEASILRPKEAYSSVQEYRSQCTTRRLREMINQSETADSIAAASHIMLPDGSLDLVRRPSSVMEPQRLHCAEMMEVKSEGVKEGECAWYLQGNQVARENSVFEGEMIKRYNVTWGCKANHTQATDEGAGSGEDFIDSLQKDDIICVWARAKVGVESVAEFSMLWVKTRANESAEARMGEPRPRCSGRHPIHDLAHIHDAVSGALADATQPRSTSNDSATNGTLQLMSGGCSRRDLASLDCSERIKPLV